MNKRSSPATASLSAQTAMTALAAPLIMLMAVSLLPACSVTREQQTVGSYIDDTTLTTRVKARFAQDSDVSVLAINVETLKGVVQLSGFARSARERAMAESLARGVPGVVAVRNDIIVSS